MYFTIYDLKAMSDEDLAREIRECPEWNADLCGELCYRAGVWTEWEVATGENFTDVVYAAANALGVDID